VKFTVTGEHALSGENANEAKGGSVTFTDFVIESQQLSGITCTLSLTL
jgi:hypothetical protein